jgi:hypothetical protein
MEISKYGLMVSSSFAKMRNIKWIVLLCIFMLFICLNTAFCDDTSIRAKIGIQISSSGKNKLAKSRDRLKTGDFLRIFVHPEKASYVYVVYSDRKDVSLLSVTEQKILSSSIVLPSVNEFYEIDGKSNFERFTIICSPKEIIEITQFFKSNPSFKKWESFEQTLVKKSRIQLNDRSDLPFPINGVARSQISPDQSSSIVKKLKIFTGNYMVVKKYEFRVAK